MAQVRSQRPFGTDTSNNTLETKQTHTKRGLVPKAAYDLVFKPYRLTMASRLCDPETGSISALIGLKIRISAIVLGIAQG